MGKEKDNAKKFSRYLDRLLAGQDVPDDLYLDTEMREALDFARRMNDMKSVPSAAFQAQLKERLLRQLAEKESARTTGVGSFWNIFRYHPAWRVALAAVMVIVVFTLVWRYGFYQPSLVTTPTPTAPVTATPSATVAPTATVAPGTLVFATASTDKTTYQAGEPVNIKITLTNESQAPLDLVKTPPIISVMDEDTGEPVFTFNPDQINRTLQPHQATTFVYAWNQLDFEGRSVFGRFYVELEDLEYQGRFLKLDLSQPLEFEITTW